MQMHQLNPSLNKWTQTTLKHRGIAEKKVRDLKAQLVESPQGDLVCIWEIGKKVLQYARWSPKRKQWSPIGSIALEPHWVSSDQQNDSDFRVFITSNNILLLLWYHQVFSLETGFRHNKVWSAWSPLNKL